MDKLLFGVLNTYFGTVDKTGYLPFKSVEGIIVLDFINDLLEDEYYISCEDRYIISKLYNCIIENNCLV